MRAARPMKARRCPSGDQATSLSVPTTAARRRGCAGLRTRYAHMFANGLLVHVGDTVTGGQNIARVGNTGASTACHLHFEVYADGTTLDPVPYLVRMGVVLR